MGLEWLKEGDEKGQGEEDVDGRWIRSSIAMVLCIYVAFLGIFLVLM